MVKEITQGVIKKSFLKIPSFLAPSLSDAECHLDPLLTGIEARAKHTIYGIQDQVELLYHVVVEWEGKGLRGRIFHKI